MPRSLRTGQVHQRSSNIGVMLNVLCVVISKAKELLQFLNRGWFQPCTNSLNLIGVRAQTTSFDNVPQVLNWLLTKETLLTFCKQFLHMQFLKHSMQIQHVLFNGGTKTRILSKYIVIQRVRSENVKFISRWKVAGALHNPMGMTRYSYKPYGAIKAVFASSPSRMQT